MELEEPVYTYDKTAVTLLSIAVGILIVLLFVSFQTNQGRKI